METLHPALVHFAIVLPLVALSMQALYLLKGEKNYSKVTLVTLVFLTIFVLMAYLTGSEDGSNVGETLSVYNPSGMAVLKEHAQLGFYLLIATSLIVSLKLLNFYIIKKRSIEIIIVICLFALSIMMLVQGKEGGEIVYEHGTLFEAHELKDVLKESLVDLKDSDDKDESLEILTGAINAALKKD